MKAKLIEAKNDRHVHEISNDRPHSQQLVNEKIEAVEPEPIEVKEDERKPLEAYHDLDDNTVLFILENGYEMVISEPRGKHFLEAESWLSTQDVDRRTVIFLMMRLALACSKFSKDGKVIPRPKMEEFLDIVDSYAAFEGVGKCLQTFQSPLNDYLERIKARQDSLGDSKQTV